MRKITCILVIGIMFLFCACATGNEDYKYQTVDVTTKNETAKSFYEDGEYEDSLELYLEAMQENPKDIDARIGAVKCQIAMENYDMALMNLNSAVRVAPQNEEVYELYLQISKLTDNIYTAQTAVSFAKQYNADSFLEKIPQKPILDYESGKYNQKIAVSVESAEDDVEIYVSVSKVDSYSYSNVEYMKPWTMTTGETKLTAYCVKDGIPSETVEATYICEYAPSIVYFEDPVMEQLVRNTLGKTEGEITDIDCEQLTTLDSYDLRTDEMDYNEYKALKIHSLRDLQFFPNLSSLYLREQSEIADYSCVSLCPLLRQLFMQGCKITDVDFLAEVPFLTSLYLPDNQLTDINQVLIYENLRYLDIEGNPIKDISGVANLEKLYSISFDVDQTKDMSFLLQLENLTSLSLSRHDDTDLSLIGQLAGLKSLTIDYDDQENESYDERVYIKDISYVENLRNLEYLSISYLEDLTQVNCLKGLQNLQDLYLFNRKNRDTEKDEAIIKDLQQALPQCNINY